MPPDQQISAPVARPLGQMTSREDSTTVLKSHHVGCLRCSSELTLPSALSPPVSRRTASSGPRGHQRCLVHVLLFEPSKTRDHSQRPSHHVLLLPSLFLPSAIKHSSFFSDFPPFFGLHRTLFRPVCCLALTTLRTSPSLDPSRPVRRPSSRDLPQSPLASRRLLSRQGGPSQLELEELGG